MLKIILSFLLVGCLPPYDYNFINKKENLAAEKKRTQILGYTHSGTDYLLKLRLKIDSSKLSAMQSKNGYAYALRFKLNRSETRSKTIEGGTFVLFFKLVGTEDLKVENFTLSQDRALRINPYSSTTILDTMTYPPLKSVVSLKEGSKACILQNCPGVLKPSKKGFYEIGVELSGAKSELWSFDHGFPIKNKTMISKIENETGEGISVTFS